MGFDATSGRRPVYSWRDAIIQGTNIPGYPSSLGEDICRASPAAPQPPSVLQTMGTVKVPLDFLLYLYPTMHYCSMGCNMPTALGGTSCGPWDTDCHTRDSDILATNTMHTFESINGWYGDTGSRRDGLLATSVSNAVEVTGACKICGWRWSLQGGPALDQSQPSSHNRLPLCERLSLLRGPQRRPHHPQRRS